MEQMTQSKRIIALEKDDSKLDLNASQQKEMSKNHCEQSTKESPNGTRKANKDSLKKQLTSDERFAKKSQMLDEQIVMKREKKNSFSRPI
jgi:hypothetical protein